MFDNDGDTALLNACYYESFECAKLLLVFEFHINTKKIFKDRKKNNFSESISELIDDFNKNPST